jgi:hypothetical protein
MPGLKKFTRYIKYSTAAAILYCIVVWIYIRDLSFTDSWLLYVGNFLFAFAIAVFIFRYNHQRAEKASSIEMIKASVVIAVTGVLISCVVIVMLLLIYTPDVFNIL